VTTRPDPGDGVDREAERLIDESPDAAVELPTRWFTHTDVESEPERELVTALSETSAIEVHRPGGEVHYRLTDAAQRYVDRVDRQRSVLLPCGHSGLENIDGMRFECTYPPCDEQFGVDEVGDG